MNEFLRLNLTSSLGPAALRVVRRSPDFISIKMSDFYRTDLEIWI